MHQLVHSPAIPPLARQAVLLSLRLLTSRGGSALLLAGRRGRAFTQLRVEQRERVLQRWRDSANPALQGVRGGRAAACCLLLPAACCCLLPAAACCLLLPAACPPAAAAAELLATRVLAPGLPRRMRRQATEAPPPAAGRPCTCTHPPPAPPRCTAPSRRWWRARC
jgi:hypothetical protein